MILYSKNIVTLDGLTEGFITIEDGKIKSISTKSVHEYLDYSNQYIFPGFIDMHVHGYARGSFIYEGTVKSLDKMSKDMLNQGVTGFLATTFTDELEKIENWIEEASKVYKTELPGSQLLGIHLEGPFINKKHKGLQKEGYCLLPDVSIMERLLKKQNHQGMVKLITLAPELRGAENLVRYCKENGIQVSAGHTDARFEEIKKARQWGVAGVTHMFSAMRPMHHRELGVVGAALFFEDLYCEFAKQTGKTICHEAFDIVYRVKGSDKIILTTDCLGLSQIKENMYHYVHQYELEPHENKLIKKYDNGDVDVFDKSSYKSCSKLEMGYLESIQEVVKHHSVSPVDIMKMTSYNPSSYLNLSNKGLVKENYDADLTILNSDYSLNSVFVKGRKLI